MINLFGFFIGRQLAEREGLSPERANQLALAGAVNGGGVLPALLVQTLARREAAELAKPAPTVGPATPSLADLSEKVTALTTTVNHVFVPYPNVVGLDSERAADLLRAFKLEPNPARGTVVSAQDPAPVQGGSGFLLRGSVIKLTTRRASAGTTGGTSVSGGANVSQEPVSE